MSNTHPQHSIPPDSPLARVLRSRETTNDLPEVDIDISEKMSQSPPDNPTPPDNPAPPESTGDSPTLGSLLEQSLNNRNRVDTEEGDPAKDKRDIANKIGRFDIIDKLGL